MNARYVCTLLALAVVTPVRAADGPNRPNVLFIMADDLRPELGCYGSAAKTPNLDALAARGVRFDSAYCQQALCNPSRSSLLTGQRPDTLRLWSNGTHFRDKNPDVKTLPQWFKDKGYDTRCVGKIFHNWHTKEKGDRKSWSADEFLHYANHGDDVPEVKGEVPKNHARDLGRDYGKVPLCERRDVPDEAYYDGRVAAEAVRVMGAVKDKPFFLAVGFWKPHAPFNAPKKYWDMYDPAKLPKLAAPERPKGAPAVAFHDGREILGLPPKQIAPTAEQVAEMRHGYFANISYMDAQVGKVLKALDDNELTESTVVVFRSDHGYHIGEFGLWGKTSCFEFDARVPLIVARPDSKGTRGTVARGIVELIDVFPTLCSVCGIDLPPDIDGGNFRTVLADPRRNIRHTAFTQHPRPAYFDRTEKGVPEAMGYSVRTRTFRYTEWRDWATGKLLSAELYDATVPAEKARNLIDETKETDELKAVRSALHDRFRLK